MALFSSHSLLDREKLIDAVRERPAIWDKNAPEYKIKNARTEAWQEICSILHDDYDNISQLEKREFYLSVLKAWTVIRDGWVRSIKKGRCPYHYHNKLLFLEDVINPQYNTKEQEYEQVEYLYPESDDDDTDDDDDDKSEESEEVFEVKPELSKIFEEEIRIPKKRRIKEDVQSDREDEYQDGETELKPKRCRAFQDEIRPNKGEDVMVPFVNYEDRHLCFFKSIQPALETLNEEEVLQFQSGVLRLLQTIRKRHT